jgi:hypothetical protein
MLIVRCSNECHSTRLQWLSKETTQLDVERDRFLSRPLLSSLAAFVGAALRPRSLLARAIVTVLAIKLIAVAGMAVYAHFSDQSAAVDAAAVDRLLGPSSRP